MNFSGATAVCMKNRLYQFVGLKGNKVLPVNFVTALVIHI